MHEVFGAGDHFAFADRVSGGRIHGRGYRNAKFLGFGAGNFCEHGLSARIVTPFDGLEKGRHGRLGRVGVGGGPHWCATVRAARQAQDRNAATG